MCECNVSVETCAATMTGRLDEDSVSPVGVILLPTAVMDEIRSLIALAVSHAARITEGWSAVSRHWASMLVSEKSQQSVVAKVVRSLLSDGPAP